jgi:2-amino-4-hydroxy-6-hydroxymethyldihydropteridine diphosphokinase
VPPRALRPAVGFDGPPFLNGVAAFEVDAPPLAVWQVLRDIEGRAGRDRSSGMLASRPLDLDLLLYGALVRSEPPLRLPHPDVTRYSFVLRPLADLAPDERHPVLGRTFADLDASLALEPAALERVALDFGDDASGDSDLTG